MFREISAKNSSAKINLGYGGSLSSLILESKSVIKPLENPVEAYASSILFPYVNRINNGRYSFNSENFQLEKNMPPNAIHGLVYNKTFKLGRFEENEVNSTLELIYNESKGVEGFPFTYIIKLIYILNSSNLTLKIAVENTDEKPFPFSLGWHPYFYVKNVDECQLSFNASEQFVVDVNMIPIKTTKIEWNDYKALRNLRLDDGFRLNGNYFKLKTPEYQITCRMNSNEKFLQIYTPDDRRFIAIEPMTAATDSLNNKIGLQILKPNQKYETEWKIELQ